MNRIIFTFTTLIFGALLLCSCSGDIAVKRVDRSDYFAYYDLHVGEELTQSSSNLLADHLLLETLENDPDKLLEQLIAIFLQEPRPEYLAVMADSALNIAARLNSSPEKSIRFYLAAAMFSYQYLKSLDKPETEPYSLNRVQMIQIYNVAVGEIFDYLRQKKLHRCNGYSLQAASGQQVTFLPEKYDLALPADHYADFHLCADYKPVNLTHVSKQFGIGVPLICELHEGPEKNGTTYARDQMLPASLVIDFMVSQDLSKVQARLVFVNTRECDVYKIGEHPIPLAMDFSTPIAYMAKRPLPLGHLSYMLYPVRGRDMEGLYKFEPFTPDRIPVVMVHGLMSNSRTWIQMLNTLQNDPDIRKNYQFWGFSYSSGYPVLYSAKLLREALTEERNKLIRQNIPVDKFDRMVLIGHSMGGLLSKTAILDNHGDMLKEFEDIFPQDRRNKLSDKQQKSVKDILDFGALSFVKRVIFIAVPHRGSVVADNFIGRLGSALIELPGHLIKEVNSIVQLLFPQREMVLPTGIDNLMPDDRALRAMESVKFVSGVPYHSIIGNRKESGVPDGSDGIVPYQSSHLEGAQSELIVKSGHSAQQNPLGIQEVRRILIEHLRGYKDITVTVPVTLKHVVPKRK